MTQPAVFPPTPGKRQFWRVVPGNYQRTNDKLQLRQRMLIGSKLLHQEDITYTSSSIATPTQIAETAVTLLQKYDTLLHSRAEHKATYGNYPPKTLRR